MAKPSKLERDTERFKRQRKIECALIRGHVNQLDLATRYGVTQATISRDIYDIRRRWSDEVRDGKIRDRRFKRIKQLEFLYTQAVESYERSRQDDEEVVTQHKPISCTSCAATGKVNKVLCKDCDGTGSQIIEVTTRRVRGQAGNAAFLEQARKNLIELCKLEGLIVPAAAVRARQAVVINSGVISNDKPDDPFAGVPSDVVLAARTALLRLRDARSAIEKEGASEHGAED